MKNSSTQKGFTLVELLVSVSIFVFMTAFLVFKYGTFNHSVIVTNTAYDIALTIRNAQSYGLNVKASKDTNPATIFSHGFGAHFQKSAVANGEFYFFSDLDNDGLLTPATEKITISTIKKGIIVDSILASCGGPEASYNSLDVVFVRPDPDAIIRVNGSATPRCQTAKIIIKAPDGATKTIVVRSTGQIAIEN